MAFPFDQSFKLLTDEDARGSLTHLAGIKLPSDAIIESLDRELNQERSYADHLFRVRSGGEEMIHHFEALTYYRPTWGSAQMKHAVGVDMKYSLPVYSHLLLLYKEGVPAVIPDRIVRKSGDLGQELRVNVIRLWQRPAAEALASGSVALCPWTALMDATVEQQREAARRIGESGREGLRMQMTLLGSLRYGSKEEFLERLGRMFLTKDILRETPMWREIEQEGRAEGMARGMAEGKAEGKAEGLAEGERRVLHRLLTRRFGPLPEWAEQKLTGADVDALERWSDRVLDATSLNSALD